MAFNPFTAFRKHKKVIFAMLTILCMVTFVLCSGFGDASQWLFGLLGVSSRQGDVVTELYGKEVYEGEINERARLRQIASQVTQIGVARSNAKLGEELIAYLSRTTPDRNARGPDADFREAIVLEVIDLGNELRTKHRCRVPRHVGCRPDDPFLIMRPSRRTTLEQLLAVLLTRVLERLAVLSDRRRNVGTRLRLRRRARYWSQRSHASTNDERGSHRECANPHQSPRSNPISEE